MIKVSRIARGSSKMVCPKWAGLVALIISKLSVTMGLNIFFSFNCCLFSVRLLINNKINIDKTAAVVTWHFLRAASDVFLFVCFFFLNEIQNLQKLKT